ncbi:ashwin-like [Zootermopsis nevadensis]|uniref:Ashwin n=1 Tax=Zootermopsis nevadensis TaxID=136037 RepID=A0A067RS44_ZOONE|nr:ashwin-like [Zootermopsis nevadensis]KDR22614.1 Ashwin [Zootermopsis nevadensis]
MASSVKESNDFYLLQPELLNETALKQILESRCVKLQNLNFLSKAQLVKIFYQVAVPLPQREYKDNRRGKLLTRLRRKQEINSQKTDDSGKKSSITCGFSEASTSHGLHGTGVRLKPPPDTINFEHKKIKLRSSSSRSDDLESIQIKRLKKFEKSDINGGILDRIIINDRRKEKEKEEKGDTQSIKQKPTDESTADVPVDQSKLLGCESCSSEKVSGSRKVKLKRSHSTSSSENPLSACTTGKDLEVKKNKTKIIWP